MPKVSPFASDVALWLILSGNSYSCLEQISMFQKMFELLKLDCNRHNPIVPYTVNIILLRLS